MYHNICRHRGNKLVWTDFPQAETNGTCRQFQCKYHAWRYDLEGQCTFVQQEQEFFELDKADLSLASVQCDVWEGWIFVNLDASNTAIALRSHALRGGTAIAASPASSRRSSGIREVARAPLER